jgi:hypothetical protein
MLKLGPRGRVVFCALFFGSEAVLIATATMRSDQSYGFRMFPESSSITVHVDRKLDGDEVEPIVDGRWEAEDCDGKAHTWIWNKMVRSPATWRFDKGVGAPYGVENQVQRTRDALVWVADHTPSDCETRGFSATIEARRNGHAPERFTLEVPRAR